MSFESFFSIDERLHCRPGAFGELMQHVVVVIAKITRKFSS